MVTLNFNAKNDTSVDRDSKSVVRKQLVTLYNVVKSQILKLKCI